MNRSTPGFPVHHQLPESPPNCVHCVGDAIQPSHPLSSPSLPALNLSQHQGLFQWVSSACLKLLIFFLAILIPPCDSSSPAFHMMCSAYKLNKQGDNIQPWCTSFTWGGQSTGVSASTSVLPMNTQDWSPLGWTGWISLQSRGLSRVFSNTTVQKHEFFCTQLS